MLRKLLTIVGPVFLALLLVLVTILSFPTSLSPNLKQEKNSAVAISDASFKNGVIKHQALGDSKHHFVPFFGSSEWSRMDSMHPSVIAERYHRSYRPFLIGNRGSQSLTHYYGMQQISKDLKGGKAVFVISPQWFTPQGSNSAAVQMYLSKTQIFQFLLKSNGDSSASFAAKRMLELNPGIAKSNLLRKVSQGKPLSSLDSFLLKCQYQIALREESLFSFLVTSDNYQKRIKPRVAGLPKTFSYDKLEKLAIKRGEAATSNNPFKIKNSFYTKRIGKKVNKYKLFQKNFVYTSSPEYNDFQLILSEFAKQKTDVLFVIPPVNQEWAKYTGLNQEKYQAAVHKIKFQLMSQGFEQIADFSTKGGDPYFMEDTIHLGWNGWLALDKQLHPFMARKNQVLDYHLDPYFYSQDWAKRDSLVNNQLK